MTFPSTATQPAHTEASIKYNQSSSLTMNASERNGRIHLLTPIDPVAKRCIFISMAVVCVLGFFGNVLVAFHLKAIKNKWQFRRNINFTLFSIRLNYYLSSLVISDILCPLVTLPLCFLQLFSDVFQKDWHCKIERFLYFVFPCVTINNLLVIAVERLFASREIRRGFSFSTVKGLIAFAWLSAFLITFLPVANFKIVQYDLNATHFTTTCRFDNSVPISRVAMLTFTVLEFILPSIVLIFCNICVMKEAWQKLQFVRRSLSNSRHKRESILMSKGIFMLVAITFAFIIPYLLSFTYIMFNSIAKPTISYQTDFIIRNSGGVLVTANSAINVLIYTFQLSQFRARVKSMVRKLFLCKLPSAEKVESKEEGGIIPHNGIEERNADNNNNNNDNIEEVEDKQLRNETERGKAPCVEQLEMQEPRAATLKRENNFADKVNEEQTAVNRKKETGCRMLIAVDVH